MEYRWITEIDKFKGIASDWDEALIASGEDNPFLLSEFIITWWRHYSEDLGLRIFVLCDNGKIVGGLPLCQKRSGYLEYPGGIASNYTEPLSLGSKQAFWKYFFESLTQLEAWRCLKLRRIRQSRLNADQVNTAASRHKEILLDLNKAEHSYFINIPDDFADYIRHLPKKLRYYVKRSEREFSKLGLISLCSFKNEDEIKALAETYICFSRDSFRKRNKQSAFEDETYCSFFRELIPRMHKEGHLDANALRLNDRSIAIHFGYSVGNNLNYIFPAFDISFADLNPGHLLIYKLIELGAKRKNKLFDLYPGHSFYKEQWCDHKEEIFSLCIRPNRFLGKLEMKISRQARGSLIINKSKEIIRKSTVLMPLAKKAKKFMRNYL